MKTLLLVLLFCQTSWASPLTPIKLDTPRDTMKSYLSAMKDYLEGVKNNDPAKMNRLDDAVRTFNLAQLQCFKSNDPNPDP